MTDHNRGHDGPPKRRAVFVERAVRRSSLPFTLCLLLLATWLAYYPGLSGPFQFDDAANITQNAALDIAAIDRESLSAAATSGVSGPLLRPLAYISFALNRHFLGHDPAAYKHVNLVIHMANAFLVFVMTLGIARVARCRRWLRGSALSPAAIALLAASIWALHPINLTAVLYIVQRMASLSTLFVLAALCLYVYWRPVAGRALFRDFFTVLAIVICFSAGIFTKESAALLPVYILVIELILFTNPDRQSVRVVRWRQRVGTLLPIVAVVSLVLVIWLAPELFSAYRRRDFDMAERALTQARVVWFYLGMIAFPHPHEFSLFHDHFSVSRALLQPPSTLVAIIGLIGLAGVASWSVYRLPLLALCVYLFFAAHGLESTVFPLELVYEHRNYFASVWAALGGALLVAALFRVVPTAATRCFLVVAILSTLFLVTNVRALAWSDELRLAETHVRNYPDSARARGELARVLIGRIGSEDDDVLGLLQLRAHVNLLEANRLEPDNPHAYFGLFRLWGLAGKTEAPPWFSDFIDTLETTKRTPVVVTQLRGLSDCRNVACRNTPELLAEVVQAALRNPYIAGNSRSEVLVAGGRLFSHIGNADTSIALFAGAVEASPSAPQYRLLLAEALAHFGREADALQELARLQAAEAPFWIHQRARTLRDRLQ